MSDHWMPQRIAEIIDIVCRHFGYRRQDMFRRDRHKTISCARAIAMRLARDEGYSFPELGRAFDRDHTTVMSACGKVAGRAVRDNDRVFNEAFWECAAKWTARRAELYGPGAVEAAE